jgi:hypothetical protein
VILRWIISTPIAMPIVRLFLDSFAARVTNGSV